MARRDGMMIDLAPEDSAFPGTPSPYTVSFDTM
jgi:hypothetical protein